jgi:hypothetical protein
MFADCKPLAHIHTPHVDQLKGVLDGGHPDALVYIPGADDTWLRAHVERAWANGIWTIDGAGRRERREAGKPWKAAPDGAVVDFLKEAAIDPRQPTLYWLRDLPETLPGDVEGRLKALTAFLRESGSRSRVVVSGVVARPAPARRADWHRRPRRGAAPRRPGGGRAARAPQLPRRHPGAPR